MIFLCSIYAGSALAEPISLLCSGYVEVDGEWVKEINSLYIDIEEDEMFYTGEERKKWTVLEDMKVDRVSVSGTQFLGSKEIYITYTVDRTDLELNSTMSIFGDTKILSNNKCEIAGFKIERAF